MNCVNCGGRITSDGCTCTSTANDLLKKLERSNDDWINAQEEIAELNEEIAGLKAERKESFEQSIAIIHDLKAENILLEKRLEPIFNVWGRWNWRHPKLTKAAVERSVKSVLGMAAAFEKMKREKS